jgi:hypothetical protein
LEHQPGPWTASGRIDQHVVGATLSRLMTRREQLPHQHPGVWHAVRRTFLSPEPPMTVLERHLLDALAELIARDMLRHQP